jgi:hypothetical protein
MERNKHKNDIRYQGLSVSITRVCWTLAKYGGLTMTAPIRTLCATALLLGASVFAGSNTASAQEKGHKAQKAEQKVAKAVYKADKGTPKVIRQTHQTAPRRYRAVRRVRILCEDGTWSTGGRAACASHGGVAARQLVYKVPPPRASARARARASANSALFRGTYVNMNPRGAIARCHDGTYWHSRTRLNACVRHGGVATWM